MFKSKLGSTLRRIQLLVEGLRVFFLVEGRLSCGGHILISCHYYHYYYYYYSLLLLILMSYRLAIQFNKNAVKTNAIPIDKRPEALHFPASNTVKNSSCSQNSHWVSETQIEVLQYMFCEIYPQSATHHQDPQVFYNSKILDPWSSIPNPRSPRSWYSSKPTQGHKRFLHSHVEKNRRSL